MGTLGHGDGEGTRERDADKGHGMRGAEKGRHGDTNEIRITEKR